MFMFITAITMVSQTVGHSKSTEPATNPGTWVNSNEYPADARNLGIEGSTEFLLTIGTNGKVKSCVVTGSSGSSSLDLQTCRSMSMNGRFRPALNENGNPVEGKWASAVQWVLPETMSFPFHSEHSTRIVMIQEKNGTISSCKLEEFDNAEVEEEVCKRTKKIFAWPEGHAHQTDRKKIVYTLTETKDVSILED
ncbi:TonB family protein [Parasphingorhabdus sp.]|jgi:TonB family protein|uniref:TonB family protein n=1 Tax=Parasphingorhabdus sp. TaxID=2709688 RepID=UPI003D2B220E